MKMRLRKDSEDGVVLVTVLLLTMIMMIIVAGTLAYAIGSQPLSRRDQDYSSALSAAEAGLDDYLFRLNENDQYYLYNATTAPPDGNQAFNTWVSVPDSGAASATCTASANSNIPCFRYSVDTTNLTAQGAIIISSTGRSRNVTRTIQATLRRHAFIDYLYFTDFETTDPAAYVSTDYYTPAEAQTYCAKHYYEGRDINGRDDHIAMGTATDDDSGGAYCRDIVFGSGDVINGPLHSNDAIKIASTPTFNGKVTTSWNPATGNKWVDGGSSAAPVFSQAGDPKYADPLTMPPSNVAIKTEADGALGGVGCLFTGPTSITLNSGGTMTVVSPGSLNAYTNANCVGVNKPLPASGVIYVQNVPSSATDPNYTAACRTSTQLGGAATVQHPLGYPQLYDNVTTYGCKNGDVFLKGTLQGRLTIAADNNIDIIGNVTYQSGTGGSDLLGLVANNYVEIYHPVTNTAPSGSRDGSQINGYYNLDILPGSTGLAFHNPVIQAAILSVQHSFRVQNHTYGDNNLGSITLNGAIAQKYRGAVGTLNNSGYTKNYNYDPRLKYQSPPHFLNPIAAAWQIVTWVEQKAACGYNATTTCP